MLKPWIDSLDTIPLRVLAFVNLGIAAFVGLAHGGAWVLASMDSSPEAIVIQALAPITVSLATSVAVSAVFALLRSSFLPKVLALQGILLAVGGAALFVWALSILLHGIPKGNFSWAPGMLTFLCAYPVYLLRRTILDRFCAGSVLARYAHLIAVAIVVPVDVGVFIRAVSSFFAMARGRA
jgi:hypothetical protein